LLRDIDLEFERDFDDLRKKFVKVFLFSDVISFAVDALFTLSIRFRFLCFD